MESKASDNLYFIPVLLEETELPNITVGTISLQDYHAIKLYNPDSLKKLLSFLKRQVGLIQEAEESNPNKNRIKEFISKDKIEKAIELLKNWGENSEYYNTILLLERRHRNLKKSFLGGTISDEFYRREENRILIAVLEISDLL